MHWLCLIILGFGLMFFAIRPQDKVIEKSVLLRGAAFCLSVAIIFFGITKLINQIS